MSLIQKLLRSIDFRWNEAINFVLQRFSVLENSQGREGQLAYSDGGVYVHNGAEWVPVGGGSQTDTQVFDFSADASDSWVINHNLGKLVTVQTMDLFGNRIEGTVNWDLDTLDTVTVTFTEPMQGRAVIGYGKGDQSQMTRTFTDSDTWIIDHGLGRFVIVQTMDSRGQRVEGTVQWDLDTLNTVTVTFTAPVSGTALIL